MLTQTQKLYNHFNDRILFNFDEYNGFLCDVVPYYNKQNCENNKRVYYNYITVFNFIMINNLTGFRTVLKLVTLTKLGIFSLSNRKKEYWLERGYLEEEIPEILRKWNDTSSIEAICKDNICTAEEAKIILKVRSQKSKDTYNIKSDAEKLEINYKKGSSVRKKRSFIKNQF